MSDKHRKYDYISAWLSDYNAEKFAKWLYHKPELETVFRLVKQWVEDENAYQNRPNQPEVPPESSELRESTKRKLKDLL